VSVVLVLVLLALALAAFVLLGRWSRNHRARLGIDRGAIVSADDSVLAAPTLRSERLGLTGRCDQLVRIGDTYLPMEQKPSARRLYPSHVLQVGALCLLVQEVHGKRPPYGVVVLADGVRERVPFTEELDQRVNDTMREMRSILASDQPPGRRWVAAKCRACGYHPVCWDGSNLRSDHD
jgi:CRISPR-associated exonuclease Cas4